PAELNLLIQLVAVTDDPGPALAPLLERQPQLTPDAALELPIVLVGTLDEIVARVHAHRERFGFSYLTVLEPHMEAFAPVLEA
ncbi:LLM class F420-dependent oxidoreductase, partial [Streptomyces sp. SID625]|nr:LLM class F420-dependent oxidoreductase [Streptomyces sp. SID625]